MVDEFLGIDGNVSRTRFAASEDNLFVEDGVLTECGIIEHIAQSAAVRMGYIFKSQNQPIPIGYIGSVNNFELKEFAKVGQVISTSIEIIQEVFGISLIQARCCVDDREIASCRMKIFLEQ